MDGKKFWHEGVLWNHTGALTQWVQACLRRWEGRESTGSGGMDRNELFGSRNDHLELLNPARLMETLI